MCFMFKKKNAQTKKPVNCFLQDDASAGIQSLQTSIEIKLCQNPWNGLSGMSQFIIHFWLIFKEISDHFDIHQELQANGYN